MLPKQLVEYVVLDIELLGPSTARHSLAEAQVLHPATTALARPTKLLLQGLLAGCNRRADSFLGYLIAPPSQRSQCLRCLPAPATFCMTACALSLHGTLLTVGA